MEILGGVTMDESIPFLIITSYCGLIFMIIGIYAIKRKTPMHFWSGTTVKVEEISDIKAYNRANGIMWISYGILMALSGLISLIFGINIGGIFLIILCTVGLIMLVSTYRGIYNKYRKDR